MFFGKGKNKIQDPYTMIDFYNFYYEEYNSNKLYMVDKKLFYELIDEFYKRIIDYILLESGEFQMPYRLGAVRVIKRKVNLSSLNHRNVDWGTTNKIGKLTFHLNEHSKYYKYLYQWDKKDKIVNYLSYYRLPMSRSNKRRLAKLIKSGKYDYYEKK